MVCEPHLDELQDMGDAQNIWPADGFVQPPSTVLCFCLPSRVDGNFYWGKLDLLGDGALKKLCERWRQPGPFVSDPDGGN